MSFIPCKKVMNMESGAFSGCNSFWQEFVFGRKMDENKENGGKRK